MGLRILSSSYTRCKYNEPLPTDPNPELFKIMNIIQGNVYTYVEVKYPNCTNFEGRKILVTSYTKDELLRIEKLDPHFLVDNKIIARFRPDSEGKSHAIRMVGV